MSIYYILKYVVFQKVIEDIEGDKMLEKKDGTCTIC